jgi:hypothetical protein
MLSVVILSVLTPQNNDTQHTITVFETQHILTLQNDTQHTNISDTQHSNINDTQHNITQHNITQHNITQHNDKRCLVL